MHITITGNLGSGKSTVCKIMEDKYGFEIYSTGKVQRELAREMNMTTLEMNQLMCSDPKYDTMIDDATSRISRENKDKKIIFDSRLAWHFVEQSFKIFLYVSIDVAANRVMNDNRGKEEKYSTIEEAKEMLIARAQTEDKRYKDMYNLEYFNYSNYNLVIDSTDATPEKIASIIMEEATRFYEELANTKKQASELAINKFLFSPKRLYQGDLSSTDYVSIKELKMDTKGKNYIGNNIKVKKQDEDYIVMEGLDEVKLAIDGNVPYVLVNFI